MADNSEALAALRGELAALREEVAVLQRDLRAARAHVDLTMRGQLRCRACGCRRIAHAPQVRDSTEGGGRGTLALYQPSIWSGKVKGQLEAYACTQCGLVEWWVSDPATLEAHEKYLHIIDGDGGGKDPYR